MTPRLMKIAVDGSNYYEMLQYKTKGGIRGRIIVKQLFNSSILGLAVLFIDILYILMVMTMFIFLHFQSTMLKNSHNYQVKL